MLVWMDGWMDVGWSADKLYNQPLPESAPAVVLGALLAASTARMVMRRVPRAQICWVLINKPGGGQNGIGGGVGVGAAVVMPVVGVGGGAMHLNKIGGVDVGVVVAMPVVGVGVGGGGVVEVTKVSEHHRLFEDVRERAWNNKAAAAAAEYSPAQRDDTKF